MYKKRKKIHDVIKKLREGNKLYYALKECGIASPNTWRNWEKKKPRLERLREAAEAISERRRFGMAEDALLQCAIGGGQAGVKRTYYPDGTLKSEQIFRTTPNPIALIFLLTNDPSGRYKDRRALVNNTNVFAPKNEKEPHERKFANPADQSTSDRLRGFLELNL